MNCYIWYMLEHSDSLLFSPLLSGCGRCAWAYRGGEPFRCRRISQPGQPLQSRLTSQTERRVLCKIFTKNISSFLYLERRMGFKADIMLCFNKAVKNSCEQNRSMVCVCQPTSGHPADLWPLHVKKRKTKAEKKQENDILPENRHVK